MPYGNDGILRPDKKRYAIKASDVDPMAPWDPRRELLRLREVPLFLMRVYAIRVGYVTVWKWAHHGYLNERTGETYYLNTVPLAKAVMVRKVDLLRFLQETGT